MPFFKVFASIALLTSFLLFAATSPGAKESQNYISEEETNAMPIPLQLLPKDKYGMVDWVTGAREEYILPLASLKDDVAKDVNSFDESILFKTRDKGMPDVKFPHKAHANWLNCDSCHSSIFPEKTGGRKNISMDAIAGGNFCGSCHGKVAFPVKGCDRCHEPIHLTELSSNQSF